MLKKWGVVALMLLPLLAFARNEKVASVCAEPERKRSCITVQIALALVFPGVRQTNAEVMLSERRSARLVYLQPLSMAGSELLALGITEVVEKDVATGSRLDCHGCAPNMIVSVFESTKGIWRLAARSKELDGVGGWGELHTYGIKTVDLGRRHLLVEMGTGFTGQGVTQTASAYYLANLEPLERLRRSIIDVGSISTGLYGCDGDPPVGISQTEVLVLRRRDLMPHFLAVETQTSCDGRQAAESGTPVFYWINPKTLQIERAQ